MCLFSSRADGGARQLDGVGAGSDDARSGSGGDGALKRRVLARSRVVGRRPKMAVIHSFVVVEGRQS